LPSSSPFLPETELPPQLPASDAAATRHDPNTSFPQTLRAIARVEATFVPRRAVD
jgi:hypothetical protein